MKNRYKKICSCCSAYIDKSQFENNVIPKDNLDLEGNLCGQCYYEQILDNWFRVTEMINVVSNAFKKSINRFKFNNKTFEEKYYICMKLMKKGILTWKI